MNDSSLKFWSGFGTNWDDINNPFLTASPNKTHNSANSLLSLNRTPTMNQYEGDAGLDNGIREIEKSLISDIDEE